MNARTTSPGLPVLCLSLLESFLFRSKSYCQMIMQLALAHCMLPESIKQMFMSQ